MKIGTKLTIGFIVIASLVGLVGIFSAISYNNIQANSRITTEVLELGILVNESLVELLALNQTENIKDYVREKTDYEQIRAEFDALFKKLDEENEKQLQDLGVNREAFHEDADQLARISNRLIALHKRELAKNKAYKEKKSLEKELRHKIQNALFVLQDNALIRDVELMQYKSQEVLYDHEDPKYGIEWLESISKIKGNSLIVPLQGTLNDINAYERVAQDLSKIVVEQETIETQKHLAFRKLQGLINLLEENNERIANKVKAESQALARNTQSFMFAVVVAAFLVSIILGLTIARSISKPVANLAQTTQAIAQGDFSVRVDVATADEIGQLAASFNKMTEDLQETTTSIDNLNREVTERKQAEEALRESERHFKQVAECAGEWIWEVNADGLYTYASPVVEKMLGYKPKEIVGKKYFYNFFAPDVKDELKRDAFSAFSKKRSFRGFVNLNVHKNGSIVILETSGTPVLDYAGNLVGYRGLDTDITERKQAEEEIRDLAKFPSEDPNPVLRIQKDGKILYGNDAAVPLLALWKTKVGGVVPAKWRRLVGLTFESEKAISNEEEVDDRIFSFVIAPVADNDYANMYARDVTEHKQAEAELKAAQEKLIETAHRAGMAEVAADVLHNVGNVLNSINVSTTVIREKVTNSEVANLEKVASIINEHTDDLGTFLTEDPQGKHIPVYLTEVSKCLQNEKTDIISRLWALVDNVQHIKDIIGMQQSYAKVSGVEVQTSISKLAEDAIQINSAGLERHGTQLIREFEELGDVEIDKQKVLQILVNLISNAKYALSGSNREEKLLTIRIYKNGEGRFRIEVTDNGVGISEDNLTKIFSYGFTTKKDGHGVGLHSSALAAKEMGGTLTVYSDGVGQGATFTLELPFKPVEVMK